MRCPKFRFPIRIIVFDELELIIFVSQGLTLSTASLVIIILIIIPDDLPHPGHCGSKLGPGGQTAAQHRLAGVHTLTGVKYGTDNNAMFK